MADTVYTTFVFYSKEEFFKRFTRLKKNYNWVENYCGFFFAFWKNNEVREVLDLSLNFLQYDFCVNIRHYTEILYFLMIRVVCVLLTPAIVIFSQHFININIYHLTTITNRLLTATKELIFFYKFLNHVLEESSCRVVHGANIL